ncbi:F-BAR domain only protein 1 [Frankliniella fusca]|uniref:F-BAR domain only protein 1 n=1 Tax=Frankliniella fusca TaxID=407009 RepID=A0AAE1LPW3_9NEOP|nr:F-BAR domain only protein 1 [Frankliniella fusca]
MCVATLENQKGKLIDLIPDPPVQQTIPLHFFPTPPSTSRCSSPRFQLYDDTPLMFIVALWGVYAQAHGFDEDYIKKNQKSLPSYLSDLSTNMMGSRKKISQKGRREKKPKIIDGKQLMNMKLWSKKIMLSRNQRRNRKRELPPLHQNPIEPVTSAAEDSFNEFLESNNQVREVIHEVR